METEWTPRVVGLESEADATGVVISAKIGQAGWAVG